MGNTKKGKQKKKSNTENLLGSLLLLYGATGIVSLVFTVIIQNIWNFDENDTVDMIYFILTSIIIIIGIIWLIKKNDIDKHKIVNNIEKYNIKDHLIIFFGIIIAIFVYTSFTFYFIMNVPLYNSRWGSNAIIIINLMILTIILFFLYIKKSYIYENERVESENDNKPVPEMALTYKTKRLLAIGNLTAVTTIFFLTPLILPNIVRYYKNEDQGAFDAVNFILYFLIFVDFFVLIILYFISKTKIKNKIVQKIN